MGRKRNNSDADNFAKRRNDSRQGSKYQKKRTGSRSKFKTALRLIVLLLAVALYLAIQNGWIDDLLNHNSDESISIEDIPEYSGEDVIVINDNVPGFTKDEITTESYEDYSPLDSLGRCGTAMACIGKDLMPTEERKQISSIKPSGWDPKRYDFIDQEMLFNRSHLIAFQLAGEDLNNRNLITGTRHLNATVMLPYEEKVGNYVRRTGNHVMYRVSPIFYKNELVARGIHMEAYSVEDKGAGVSYNIFCYNVQPGIVIDYATGESWIDEGYEQEAA